MARKENQITILPAPKDGGGAEVKLPDDRPWVGIPEFAKHTRIDEETVRRYIAQGRIATKRHPVITNRKVIPIRELNRTMMNPGGLMIPYHGMTYPHQFYIFYCLASYGSNRQALRADLINYGLIVPPEDQLAAMEKAVFMVAPKFIQSRHKNGFRYNTTIEFEQWMADLGFEEIYEDPLGFVPAAILNSDRVRFVMELLASAGFMPFEISEKVLEMSDILIETRVIANYLLMFFFHRQMEDGDWQEYITAIQRVSPDEARVRWNCADNKPEVLSVLGVEADFDIGAELKKCFMNSMALFKTLVRSPEFDKQQASIGQTRAMSAMIAMMTKLDEIETEKAAARKKPVADATNSGPEKAAIEVSAKDTDKVFSEVVQQEDQDESVTSA
jgi:hypothetical protein